MNKEQLWKLYCDKNPQFADPDKSIRMKSSMVRKLFDQTWDMACRSSDYNSAQSSDFNSIFEGIFNKEN